MAVLETGACPSGSRASAHVRHGVTPPARAARGAGARPRSRACGVVLCLLVAVPSLRAQQAAALEGRVLDVSGAVLAGAAVSVRSDSTAFDRSVATDREGRYHVDALPAGTYDVTAAAAGFQAEHVRALRIDVGRTVVQDFRLPVSGAIETITVRAEPPLIDRVTTAVGYVATERTVQQLPLNGRNFIDLGLLGPGSVAPSQHGFSSRPTRALGSLALNTAGTREEAVALVVNGVTSHNLTYGSLGFRLPLAAVQEFKIDNSTFSTEFGHVSGAIMNLVTRSGSSTFHGEAYEFLRDAALDARNFFERDQSEPQPFSRHQFGGAIGGPIVPRQAFFFVAYDGLRQAQRLDLDSLVPSDEQRAAATHPATRRLMELIPRANTIDAAGRPRFVGSAPALVDSDAWTGDVVVNVSRSDRVHAFYGGRRVEMEEPLSFGTTIPGFGHLFESQSSLVTVNHTRVVGPASVNEARAGRTHVDGAGTPRAALDPASLGIRNGVTRPIGLPQMTVAGGLSFGGPAIFPTGRTDTLYVLSDTFRHARGRHAVTLGGEYRHFINENVAEGTGTFNFPSVDAFLAGTANAFSITLGERRSLIDQRGLGLFVHDRVTVGAGLTVELGLRYEWHVTPTERNGQFVLFDAGRGALVRVGVDVGDVYRQNNRNVEPLAGVAWDVSGSGRTVLRAAYRRAVDQPGTTVVVETAGNPPLATPLTGSGVVPLDDAIALTGAAGLAPTTVDPEYTNASLDSWNVNVQREVTAGLAVTVGYLGSRGRHLRIGRNLNQPIDGVRPFPAVSPESPILPNEPLGNITQIESTGFSSYRAIFVSATRRLADGLQLDASYTWSRSLDTNSLNSFGFAVQDGYDIAGQYGLSDFDARRRFVLSAVYVSPATGRWLRDWQIAAVIQAQSGNPINIVTSDSRLNGTPNTVRPDVTGPIRIIGSPDQWFDPSAFAAVDRFGTLPRNAVIGPGFQTTDLSVGRRVAAVGQASVQVRVDVFNLFNRTNLGPPGTVVGTPEFGKITRTRLPAGEAGSSRQVQVALKLAF